MNKPNILLITTDQQRFDTISALGNNCIHTPHLDWLCDRGIAFTRCYTDSPICVPARTTIMTGKHGYNHGLTVNGAPMLPINSETSLAGFLTRNGYQTRAQGKMHFCPMRKNFGFEHMELSEDYYRMMHQTGRGRPASTGLGQNEAAVGISTVNEVDSLTHWVVDRSIDFLETRDTTRPFFLWTSFSKPHPPVDPCLSYWELYRDAEVPSPIRGDWSQTAAATPPGFIDHTWFGSSADRLSVNKVQQWRRAYYACITQIDYNLGLLFSRLREMDLLNNTLIVFTSDHGDMLGDHHMGGKGVFMEGSCHVPMIIAGPEHLIPAELKGTRNSKLCCLADIYATVENAAQAEDTDKTDGLDLLSDKERTEFFGETSNGMHTCIISGNIKYTYAGRGGSELCFNLAEDPQEKVNLAADPDHPDVKEMRARLLEHLEKRNHKLVQNGKLTPLAPMPDERTTRSHLGPGFHHPYTNTDLKH